MQPRLQPQETAWETAAERYGSAQPAQACPTVGCGTTQLTSSELMLKGRFLTNSTLHVCCVCACGQKRQVSCCCCWRVRACAMQAQGRHSTHLFTSGGKRAVRLAAAAAMARQLLLSCAAAHVLSAAAAVELLQVWAGGLPAPAACLCIFGCICVY